MLAATWPLWWCMRGLGGTEPGLVYVLSVVTQYNPSMAAPVFNLPNLAEPVTFTGADAERFLAELPTKLSPGEESRLQESVREAEASMTGAPANAVFAKSK